MEHINKIFLTLKNANSLANSEYPQEKSHSILLYDHLAEYQLRFIVESLMRVEISTKRITRENFTFTKKDTEQKKYFERLVKAALKAKILTPEHGSLLKILHQFRNEVQHSHSLSNDILELTLIGYGYFFSNNPKLLNAERWVHKLADQDASTVGFQISQTINTRMIEKDKQDFDWNEAILAVCNPVPKLNELQKKLIDVLMVRLKRFESNLQMLYNYLETIDLEFVTTTWHYPINLDFIDSKCFPQDVLAWMLIRAVNTFENNYEFLHLEKNHTIRSSEFKSLFESNKINDIWTAERFSKLKKQLLNQSQKPIASTLFLFEQYFFVIEEITISCGNLNDVIEHAYEEN